jgi:hypothetical protein
MIWDGGHRKAADDGTELGYAISVQRGRVVHRLQRRVYPAPGLSQESQQAVGERRG